MSDDYILYGHLDFKAFKTPVAGSIAVTPQNTAVGRIWEINDEDAKKMNVRGCLKEIKDIFALEHKLLFLLPYDDRSLILDLASSRSKISDDLEIPGHYSGRWIRVDRNKLKLDKTDDYDSFLSKLHNAPCHGTGGLELYLLSL